jgi:hypothetical protein
MEHRVLWARESPEDVEGAIRRSIVDEDELCEIAARFAEALQEGGEGALLVVHGDDDGET